MKCPLSVLIKAECLSEVGSNDGWSDSKWCCRNGGYTFLFFQLGNTVLQVGEETV